MSSELDYELSRYDAYSSYAQLFLRRGLAKEARMFEALADLCYEKAEMIRKIDEMVDHWVQQMPLVHDPDTKNDDGCTR
jgi:hypothetical protein